MSSIVNSVDIESCRLFVVVAIAVFAELVGACPSILELHLRRLICLNIHIIQGTRNRPQSQPYWTSVKHRSRYSDTELWLAAKGSSRRIENTDPHHVQMSSLDRDHLDVRQQNVKPMWSSFCAARTPQTN